MDRLEKIAQNCPRGMALMGMDVGRKTIGIALSDSMQSFAMPHDTIRRKKFSHDLKHIEEIAHAYDVGGYVIGYPLNMDGSEGPRCQSVRDFALEFARQISPELIKTESGLWVALWDERLSTVSVENFVDETVDISKRRAKDKGIIDKLAAQVILQGALDYLNRDQ